jgi:hypothetical protein
MNTTTKLTLAAVLTLWVSAPAQAQQSGQIQEGDYYTPGKTIVQQPTPRELSQDREGDYYPPNKTIVQQPSPQELNQVREGDYYAPTKGE